MTDLMHDFTLLFSYGSDCKNNKLPLQLVSLGDIYSLIKESPADLVETTRNLRSVLRYSKERYRALKTMLPFFSCSVFEPSYRGAQNFRSASGMILDIDYEDHLPSDLIIKLKSDPRIAMGYVSPSNAGAKILFLFDKPVEDSENYTALYRYFSLEFAAQYHIADHIDQKNCDVSRISFICHDPDAWYVSDPVLIDTGHILRHIGQDNHLSLATKSQEDELPPSVYREILRKLDSKPRNIKIIQPIHPDVLEVLPAIASELEGYGILIKETESIQYGAKIRIYRDKDQGEINVYHGRQGYSVVSSPRKGTHPELNEVAKHIIQGVLVRF